MSAEFQIEWEWLASDSSAVRSHGLTWGRLVIRGDGRTVTNALDLRARSVREGIFLPLMPLAEWLAANWWFVLEEAPPPELKRFSPRESPGQHRAWFHRHNLLAAREGFPLPDLTIAGGEDDVATLSLRADDRVYANAPVRFIESAQWLVPREVVSKQFARLTSAVVERLENCEDADAVALREVWRRRTQPSVEDVTLSRRAAALGLDSDDPDEVDEQLADTILSLGDGLPEALLREALVLGGDRDALLRRVDRIREARTGVSTFGGDALRRAREASTADSVEVLPFRQGWALARRFRERVLRVDSTTVGSALDQAITEQALLDEATIPLGNDDGCLGWVDAGANGRARCVLGQRDAVTTTRFLRARALGSALLGRRERLVTNAATRSQRIGRAFATELLAPAEAVRAMLPRGYVDDDDVNEVARRLRVSPRVVQHQIENQRLATVAWS